jgi:hypothetical protein
MQSTVLKYAKIFQISKPDNDASFSESFTGEKELCLLIAGLQESAYPRLNMHQSINSGY